MRRAMVVTVGTGTGRDAEESARSIASGIAVSLRTSNPSKVIFVVSEESYEATLPKVMEMQEVPEMEVEMLRDINDLDEAFEKVLRCIERLVSSGYDVVVDFTSGTKAMSAGAVLAATQEGVKLSYVAGKRQGGKVVRGTEKVTVCSPVRGMLRMQEKMVSGFFDIYQFEAAVRLLREMAEMDASMGEEYMRQLRIVEGYMLWDRFNHEGAFERLEGMEGVPAGNKEFLGRLLRCRDSKEPYYIADLLNNAERRAEEGKYDDAVARLYRTAEMVAQYRLRGRYGIDTGDVDVSLLGEKAAERYRRYMDERGRIRVGMLRAYELLQELGDELGEMLIADRRMRSLLTRRNESILAHGTAPVEEGVFAELRERVVELARKAVPELDSLMEKARFPVFEQVAGVHGRHCYCRDIR